MEQEDRSFTVVSIYRTGRKLKTTGGRYISTTPSGAAKKAFSQYYRNHKRSGRYSLDIHLRETTQGTPNKIFKYRVSKVQEPTTVVKDGQSIHYEYKVKIKSV
jgi:hypothetical protein